MTWSADTYFAKAQLYWQKTQQFERDSSDFLLTTSFFIELCVRGALCSATPLLNAAMEEESMMFASGLSANKPPSTVNLRIALTRLLRLVPEITEKETSAVSALIALRNSELHGDESAFSGAATAEIVPQLFSFIVRIVEFSDQSLEVLLGDSDAAQAKTTAQAIAKDRERRVRELIKIQKERFYGQSEAKQKENREANKPQFASAILKSGHHLIARECPSCKNSGLIVGLPVGRSAPILRDDGIFEEIRVLPESFECKCCDLKISGLDELMAAGFPYELTSLDEKDVLDHFSIDPIEYVDMDEIRREFEHDQYYEYMDE